MKRGDIQHDDIRVHITTKRTTMKQSISIDDRFLSANTCCDVYGIPDPNKQNRNRISMCSELSIQKKQEGIKFPLERKIELYGVGSEIQVENQPKILT